MAYEQRDNSGSLFRNDRATTDKHPTHKGQALIDGVDHWISAWVKGGENGKPKFFSLAFEPKTPVDADQRAAEVLGRRFDMDPAAVLAMLSGAQGSQAPRTGAAGHATTPSYSASPYDDDIPF